MEEVKSRPSSERVIYGGPNINTPQGYASNPPK